MRARASRHDVAGDERLHDVTGTRPRQRRFQRCFVGDRERVERARAGIGLELGPELVRGHVTDREDDRASAPTRRREASSMPGDRSTPTTERMRAASGGRKRPMPQPTSSASR